MKTFTALMMIAAAFPAFAATSETLKGNSVFGDEVRGKSCIVRIDRDDKNEIVGLSVTAPARLIKKSGEAAHHERITAGREGWDLSNKAFADFKFQRQNDLQGEGFMLRGEKLTSVGNDKKVFLHVDVREANIVGLELAQREKTAGGSTKTALEKICTALKK